MRRLGNPTRPWEGDGGSALGAIRYFASSDSIPNGWRKCLGGSFGNLKDTKAIRKALNVDPFQWKRVLAGQYPWFATASNPNLRFGRTSFFHEGYLFFGVWETASSTNSVIIGRFSAVQNPNFGENNLAQVRSRNGVTAIPLGGMAIVDGALMFFAGTEVYYEPDPLSEVGGIYKTPVATALGFTANVAPVKFGGRFFTASATNLRRSDGPGSWSDWTALTPVGMVFPVVDIVAAKIAGAETLVVCAGDGKTWVSTDGNTFTVAANLPTFGGSTAASNCRLVHDDEDTFWFGSSGVAPYLWKSTDLITWTAANPNPTLGLSALDANEGMVGVGYDTPGSTNANPNMTYSPDKGLSWTSVHFNNTSVSNSWWSIESVSICAGYFRSLQIRSPRDFTYQALIEFGPHMPLTNEVFKDGVEYNMYMKVK